MRPGKRRRRGDRRTDVPAWTMPCRFVMEYECHAGNEVNLNDLCRVGGGEGGSGS